MDDKQNKTQNQSKHTESAWLKTSIHQVAEHVV